MSSKFKAMMMRGALLVALAASAEAAPTCCWSKWGDKSTCGNYPSGGQSGLCSTDWSKKCIGPGDCPATPVPPSPGPAPPGPSPPLSGSTFGAYFANWAQYHPAPYKHTASNVGPIAGRLDFVYYGFVYFCPPSGTPPDQTSRHSFHSMALLVSILTGSSHVRHRATTP